MEVDGEAVPSAAGLFVEIVDDEFSAEGACNSFGGQFGGETFSNLMGCAADREAIDQQMGEALTDGPDQVSETQLVFQASGVSLTYAAVVVPAPDELFSALNGPEANVSELFIDSEGGPLDIDRLIRLSHPSEDARFYLTTSGENLGFYWSSENAGGSWGVGSYPFARSWALELAGRDGPLGVRVALIPDTVADSPELQALGVLENNVLTLDDSIPAGEVTVSRPDDGLFTLTIP